MMSYVVRNLNYAWYFLYKEYWLPEKKNAS
jgi:hypothetical protein